MSPPIRKGDGTELAAKGFSEVRKGDGTVLWTAEPDIPDSGDLQVHYDASGLSDASSTWSAEVGPDLSATGSPSVLADEKNGNNAVQYDRSNSEGHSSAFGSEVSQPAHIFVVFRMDSLPTNVNQGMFSGTTEEFRFEANGFNDLWRMNSGSNVGSSNGSTDTNWNIASVLYNGSNSVLRIDGSDVASGDAGSNNWDGVGLGFRADTNDSHSDVTIGEVLGYPQDKSSIQSDIESYLNDRWAVF